MGSMFDEKARWFDGHYASTRGRIRLQLILERLTDVLPSPPARILDAGGGSGAFAIPLAERGYDVTLLDDSWGMLDVARERSAEAGVTLTLVKDPLDRVTTLAPPRFAAICCHAVLLYTTDPRSALAKLRSVAAPGAVLSLLEKNCDGLVWRPGLTGDYAEAIRVLDDPVASGNLGIPNRSRTINEWCEVLQDAGWALESWAGIRLFSDAAPDDLSPERFQALLDLEREAGKRDPYRSVARLFHVLARAA
jgi:SAM-dependent methyltransferase